MWPESAFYRFYPTRKCTYPTSQLFEFVITLHAYWINLILSSSISILCTVSLNRRYFKFIVVVTVPRNQPACMQPRCLDECVLGKFCIHKKRIIFSILVVNADLLKLVLIVARWSFISLVVCRFGLNEIWAKTCLRNLLEIHAKCNEIKQCYSVLNLFILQSWECNLTDWPKTI